ncbi:phage minor head protein [Occultella kanbiaonis]|uniref:phage minor head protein n=1 Tax=Occultella kanbiaonis TaxID=2675754 RepID=UPI0013D31EB8|nr:phage minor head protein [Occultella kanbiaonis]
MAVNPEVLRLLAGMRIDLSSVVDTTVRDTVTAWATAWDELAREWDAALADLIANSQDGAWPSRSQIYRAERALRAMDATETTLERLATDAGARVLRVVPDLTDAAAEWEARLVAAQMPAVAGTQAALTAQFNRVDPAALEAIVNRTTQQVTALTRPLSVEAVQVMNRELIRGIALGDNPRDAGRRMVRRLEGGFNGGLTRATTIARTEMLDAHRNASHAQDLANLDTLTGWTWAATLDTRTCPSCLAMHGRVFPVDEPGPFDHQNGRCARVPKTKTWAELGFTGITEPVDITPDARVWFDNLSDADQAAVMGPARLDLLRTGRISWDDLPQRRTTAGWRDSYGIRSVRDLTAAAA